MSEADKMLLECGYKQIESPFVDWLVYFNENNGTALTFRNEFQSMHSKYEISFTPLLLKAIYTKAEELGWGDNN